MSQVKQTFTLPTDPSARSAQVFEDISPVALVTGGAKRIGAEIVQQLHRSGYQIIVHYNRSEIDAKALVDQLNTIRPASAIYFSADLSSCEQIKVLADKSMSHWGRLDVLVNNASSFYPTPLQNVTQAHWDDLMTSNAKGPLFLSQACLPVLTQCQGQIINLVDMHLDRPLSKFSVYSMGKAALASLTKVLAVELAPAVRVNAVAPGAILWPEYFNEHEKAREEEFRANVIDSIPLKRLGHAKDIANAVMFLTQADYITGQIITVDGGRSLSKIWES